MLKSQFVRYTFEIMDIHTKWDIYLHYLSQQIGLSHKNWIFNICKICEHFQLVACSSSFCSPNFNRTSSVTTNQSLGSDYGDFFCPLLLAERSQLREFWGTSGMYRHLQVSQQHFNWIKVQTLAGAIQSTNPLSLKPFLCSFAGMLWVIVLLHNPFCTSFNSLTNARRFWLKMCWQVGEPMVPWIIWSHPGPEAERQPQTFTFPLPCFTVERRFFSWCAVLAFLQTWWFLSWTHRSREWTSRRPLFVQVLSGKVERGSFVLFSEQRLPSSNPPMNVISFSYNYTCTHICPTCYRRGLQTLLRWCVGWPLPDSLVFWQFWFWWAELLSCWRSSICKWFVWWIELESFGDGLIALPRLMGCHDPLPHVLRYFLSSRHCWSV